ncbi:protein DETOXIFICATION 40 [Sesbania bispinosa]|nr:protein DETOXIFICATION 40 [Sesbania bispinosa]
MTSLTYMPSIGIQHDGPTYLGAHLASPKSEISVQTVKLVPRYTPWPSCDYGPRFRDEHIPCSSRGIPPPRHGWTCTLIYFPTSRTYTLAISRLENHVYVAVRNFGVEKLNIHVGVGQKKPSCFAFLAFCLSGSFYLLGDHLNNLSAPFCAVDIQALYAAIWSSLIHAPCSYLYGATQLIPQDHGTLVGMHGILPHPELALDSLSIDTTISAWEFMISIGKKIAAHLNYNSQNSSWAILYYASVPYIAKPTSVVRTIEHYRKWGFSGCHTDNSYGGT